VLGISVDFGAANQAWAEKLGLKYPLLADIRREMTRAYGVLNEDPAAAKDPKRIIFYMRAIPTVMVVDKAGTIRYVRDNSNERNTIPVDEILSVVEKLK
jgi:glutaredoxin-dependent peroxiredoxin